MAKKSKDSGGVGESMYAPEKKATASLQKELSGYNKQIDRETKALESIEKSTRKLEQRKSAATEARDFGIKNIMLQSAGADEKKLELLENKKSQIEKTYQRKTGDIVNDVSALRKAQEKTQQQKADIEYHKKKSYTQLSKLTPIGGRFIAVASPKVVGMRLGAMQKKIGGKVHAWSNKTVVNKAVLKKDTGALDISYTAKGFEDSRNPFPFKSTAQMIAEKEYERVAAYNILKQNEFMDNYRKQKRQFFID